MRINGVSSVSKTKVIQSTNISEADKIVKNNKPYLSPRDNSDKVGSKRRLDNRQTEMDILIEAVDNTNKMLEGYNRRFEISIHEKTNAVMVKVIDESTDEVIREIPPEKILDMVAALWEMAGIIVDKRI